MCLRIHFRWVCFALCLAAESGLAGFSTPRNGDFANGLADWTVEGEVTETGGEARLSDAQPPNSLLWQGVAFPVGSSLQVEFDFLDELSREVQQGFFPDSFFGSLYFIDDLSTFDLVNHVYDDRASLLDLDFGGVFNLVGAVGASDKGGDWMHYAGQFQNSHAHAIMVFEVFDLDGAAANSAVRVDNVSFTIPEPRSLLLWVVGGWVCMGRRSLQRWLRWIRDVLSLSPGGGNP